MSDEQETVIDIRWEVFAGEMEKRTGTSPVRGSHLDLERFEMFKLGWDRLHILVYPPKPECKL